MSNNRIIANKDNKILYIPLSNKFKRIVGYAKADLEDYDKLKDLSFTRYISRSGKTYAQTYANGKYINFSYVI